MMNLKILLPYKIFSEKTKVLNIVAETSEGSFGILPHRLDCVSALSPGILIFETKEDGEEIVAIDEGILVKTGFDVLVSVRQALSGVDLSELRDVIKQEFLVMEEYKKHIRAVMKKLETRFLIGFANLQHE